MYFIVLRYLYIGLTLFSYGVCRTFPAFAKRVLLKKTEESVGSANMKVCLLLSHWIGNGNIGIRIERLQMV
eukprot:m.751719 g.751719  ORF g.751719 m.751719 type:complete len:71 (-) comp23168_c0_seq22:2383-2595(-)